MKINFRSYYVFHGKIIPHYAVLVGKDEKSFYR